MSGPLSPLEQAAVESIDAIRIERELRTIMAISSVTGDEEAVQAAMAELMAEAGLSVECLVADPLARDGPGLAGQRDGSDHLPGPAPGRTGPAGGRRMIILGHVDVVPVGDETLWQNLRPPRRPSSVGRSTGVGRST